MEPTLLDRLRSWSDNQLVSRAQRGHRRAWELLVERWTPRVAAVLRGQGLQGDEVEEMTQTTLVRTWEHLDRIDPSRPAWPWVVRIAQNGARDLHRRKRVASRHVTPLTPEHQEVLPSEDGEPSVTMSDQEFEDPRVAPALASLPAGQRAILEAWMHGECPSPMSATQRSRVFRAVQALRQAMGVGEAGCAPMPKPSRPAM
jgi:RNA polymerase sigma-70 factor (ECF subfamily)